MTTSVPAARRVLVTGASGLIGSALVPALGRAGWDVWRVVRRAPASERDVAWNPTTATLAPLPQPLAAVVNLAGEPIATRWTASRRRRVLESRVGLTRALSSALAALAAPPAVLVSGSAVGWYGDRGDEILDEASGPGGGFLAEVARAWEDATAAACGRMRVAIARFGVVLAPSGGALEPLARLTRFGVGGPLGSGRQWMPWIALDDAVSALLHVIDRDALAGPVNVVAPEAVRQQDLARALGRVLHRPSLVPTPRWALRVALGAMADGMLLGSQRVVPRRLVDSGFRFRLADLDQALRAVLAPEHAA
ncbi:MAG TPA: TIGR01777 family oxidoreductase [Candidatus Saccharimonadaceae bacterium]|jgi:uncharacterized protein (TIGR01777 family)|nr:TIGR01777 family oxidoreductase [Candidatus Saccharimonadaceae bacterium]